MVHFFNLRELKTSAAKREFVLVAALIFTGYLCSAQSAARCQGGTALQPSGRGDNEQLEDMPVTKPALMPPELPNRSNLPQVPAQAAVIGSVGKAKASLAWRQKALKLSAEKFKSSSDQKSESPLLRSYDAIYSDVIMALSSSCSDCGFRVDKLNSNAGEILASSQDGQIRLVFSVWEQAEGKCWIYACAEKGNSAMATKNAISILDTVFNTISKRGRI